MENAIDANLILGEGTFWQHEIEIFLLKGNV